MEIVCLFLFFVNTQFIFKHHKNIAAYYLQIKPSQHLPCKNGLAQSKCSSIMAHHSRKSSPTLNHLHTHFHFFSLCTHLLALDQGHTRRPHYLNCTKSVPTFTSALTGCNKFMKLIAYDFNKKLHFMYTP